MGGVRLLSPIRRNIAQVRNPDENADRKERQSPDHQSLRERNHVTRWTRHPFTQFPLKKVNWSIQLKGSVAVPPPLLRP